MSVYPLTKTYKSVGLPFLSVKNINVIGFRCRNASFKRARSFGSIDQWMARTWGRIKVWCVENDSISRTGDWLDNKLQPKIIDFVCSLELIRILVTRKWNFEILVLYWYFEPQISGHPSLHHNGYRFNRFSVDLDLWMSLEEWPFLHQLLKHSLFKLSGESWGEFQQTETKKFENQSIE